MGHIANTINTHPLPVISSSVANPGAEVRGSEQAGERLLAPERSGALLKDHRRQALTKGPNSDFR